MNVEIDKVYNMDCLELMREMKLQGIKADWLIADPPYGIGYDKQAYANGDTKYGEAVTVQREYRNTNWDIPITKEYFDLMFAVSNNQIIWGGQLLH